MECNVLKNMAAGVCLIGGEERKILSANREFKEMFGFNSSEFTHCTLESLFVEKSFSQGQDVIATIREKFSGQSEAFFAAENIKKDGTSFLSQVMINPFQVKELGEMWIAVFIDIRDEMLQCRERIAEQRELLQAVMDSMTDYLAIKDRQFVYREINRAVCRYFDRQEDEIIGKTDFDIFPYHTAESYRHEDEQILETGQPLFIDKKIRLKRRTACFQVSKAPLFDLAGRMIGILCNGRDITERKKTEELLRVSEAKFRAVFENTALGISLIPLDKKNKPTGVEKIAGCNRVMQKIFGYSEEELLEKSIADLTHPHDLANALSVLDKLISGKERQCQLISRFLKKDGEILWGNLALSLICETDGRSVQLVSIVEDITRQQKELQELQNEKERYRLLYEDAPFPYQSLDKNGNILEVNKPWQKALGYSAEEVIGKPFSHFLHPDSISRFRDNFPFFLRSGQAGGVEFDMVTWDERVITVSFSGKIGRHPDGSFKQTYCVFQDITEQKRLQNALLESEKRFRCLADAAFEGIVFHENGIIVDGNSAFASMLGYGSDEIVGRQIGEFVFDKTIKDFVSGADQGVEDYHESLGQRKDGTHFPVQIQSKDMPFKGRRVRVMAMRDITTLKAAEEMLKKMNQELEKRVNERTATLLCINRQREEEILERKKTEKELISSEARLKAKQLKLQEMNTALRVLLQEASAAKDELEEQILVNLKKLIQPTMIELEGTLTTAEQKMYFNVMRTNLQQLTSSFATNLSSEYMDMTPREIQVADLIRQGKTNKDIARLLKVTANTVDFHRRNIREKLNIKGENINLRSYLLAFAG